MDHFDRVIHEAVSAVSISMKPRARSRSRRPERLQLLADEELVELSAGGDAQAFEVVVARHADAAFSLAYRICGRQAMAEDVTQEAFLAIWRGGGRYDRELASVRTWALRVVRNCAIDAVRHRGVRERRQASEEGAWDEVPAAERTDSQAIENIAGDDLHDALGVLPAAQRQAIELAYFGGFTHAEIAAMLELPVGTVKGRLRLGLRALQRQLHAWEAAPDVG